MKRLNRGPRTKVILIGILCAACAPGHDALAGGKHSRTTTLVAQPVYVPQPAYVAQAPVVQAPVAQAPVVAAAPATVYYGAASSYTAYAPQAAPATAALTVGYGPAATASAPGAAPSTTNQGVRMSPSVRNVFFASLVKKYHSNADQDTDRLERLKTIRDEAQESYKSYIGDVDELSDAEVKDINIMIDALAASDGPGGSAPLYPSLSSPAQLTGYGQSVGANTPYVPYPSNVAVYGTVAPLIPLVPLYPIPAPHHCHPFCGCKSKVRY